MRPPGSHEERPRPQFDLAAGPGPGLDRCDSFVEAKPIERLCRYLLRPPFAQHAVHWLPDHRVRLHISRQGRAVHMSPELFIAKLLARIFAVDVLACPRCGGRLGSDRRRGRFHSPRHALRRRPHDRRMSRGISLTTPYAGEQEQRSL